MTLKCRSLVYSLLLSSSLVILCVLEPNWAYFGQIIWSKTSTPTHLLIVRKTTIKRGTDLKLIDKFTFSSSPKFVPAFHVSFSVLARLD